MGRIPFYCLSTVDRWTAVDPTTGDNNPWILASPGYVLDTDKKAIDYPYSDSNNPNDNPSSPLLDDRRTEQVDDSFKMYLMWKYRGPNLTWSIWVPVQVTFWSWGFVAENNYDTWTMEGAHSVNPAGQTPNDFPVWSENVLPYLDPENAEPDL